MVINKIVLVYTLISIVALANKKPIKYQNSQKINFKSIKIIGILKFVPRGDLISNQPITEAFNHKIVFNYNNYINKHIKLFKNYEKHKTS